MGKGRHDLTLRSQCRHAIILVLGREIWIDKTSMKDIYYDGFFLVSVGVECSNVDIDVKIDSKDSLIVQSYVTLYYTFLTILW